MRPVARKPVLLAAAGDKARDDDLLGADVDPFLVVGVSLQMVQGQPQGADLDAGERQYRPGAESGKGEGDEEGDRSGGKHEPARLRRAERAIGPRDPCLPRSGLPDRQGHPRPL